MKFSIFLDTLVVFTPVLTFDIFLYIDEYLGESNDLCFWSIVLTFGIHLVNLYAGITVWTVEFPYTFIIGLPSDVSFYLEGKLFLLIIFLHACCNYRLLEFEYKLSFYIVFILHNSMWPSVLFSQDVTSLLQPFCGFIVLIMG